MQLTFANGLLLYAVCIIVAVLMWPFIKAAFGPDTTPYTNPNPYAPVGAQRGGFSLYYPGGHRR